MDAAQGGISSRSYGATQIAALDEPVGWNDHHEADVSGQMILRLRGDGDEHSADRSRLPSSWALRSAIRAGFGVMIAKGRPDQIRTNPAVLDAYLGRVRVMLQVRNLTVSLRGYLRCARHRS